MNKLRKGFLVFVSILLLLIILNYAVAKETEAWRVGSLILAKNSKLFILKLPHKFYRRQLQWREKAN